MTRSAGVFPLSATRPVMVLSPGSGGGGSAGALAFCSAEVLVFAGWFEPPHAAARTATAHSAALAGLRRDMNAPTWDPGSGIRGPGYGSGTRSSSDGRVV